MPRFIDAEMACDEVDKGDLLVGNNADFAKEIIRRTPSVDVVGVVRCGKCKRSRPMIFNGYYYCKRYRVCRKADDFCSRGKQKDGDS